MMLKLSHQMSTPYETAKRFVERIYRDFPQCPICKDDYSYRFSGWIHDYFQCNSCGAKWRVDKSTMTLVEAPKDPDSQFLREIVQKPFPFNFWKRLDINETSLLSMVSCPRCGFLNPPPCNFCGRCGASTKENFISCPSCHQPNTLDAKFCRQCGASLPEADETKIY